MNDRRHELQQNDLAIYLDKINRSVEPYSRIIAVVVGVLIVGAIGLGFYNTRRIGDRSDATLQLIQATANQDAEVLETVYQNYPDTAAGAWARLYQGQRYLSQGIQSLYSNRTNATDLLEDAQRNLKNALASSDDTLLQSRAHYGIACAAESLGNMDEAIDAYREVIAVNESEAMVKYAEERIKTLSNPSSKEFLVWFSDQDFSPADPSLPPSLPGGEMLPDLPDLNLPELSLSSEGGDEMELNDGFALPKEGDTSDAEADDKSDAEADSEPAADDETSDDAATTEKESANTEDGPATADSDSDDDSDQ